MPSTIISAVDRRAEELDTIAAVLPIERRDELAELLTDQDIEASGQPEHGRQHPSGPNLRPRLPAGVVAGRDRRSPALAGARSATLKIRRPSPLAARTAPGSSRSWNASRRRADPSRWRRPEGHRSARAVDGQPPAGQLVDADQMARRQGAFASPALKSAIRLAVRAVPRTRRRKSARAVTGDVLAKLLAACATDSLRDLRDRAILMVAYASGGRRRSEIAGLRREQLTVEPPIPVENGTPLPSLAIHLGRTKTGTREQDDVVYLTGRPVDALNAWMVAAKIESGSVFRAIGRWGTVSRRAIDPQSVNAIIKQRAVMARAGAWGVFRPRTADGISDGSR